MTLTDGERDLVKVEFIPLACIWACFVPGQEDFVLEPWCFPSSGAGSCPTQPVHGGTWTEGESIWSSCQLAL